MKIHFTKEVLEKALSLAQQTPSACNRQGWKTHIFQGENSHKLIEWQGGCHGFEDQVNTSILVTTDLRAFLFMRFIKHMLTEVYMQ